MVKRLVFLTLVLTVPCAAAEQAAHVSIAGRDVAVWKPSGAAAAGGYPVILFSHGFGGCNTQSVFLMEALARAGYLVLAPNHKDARCGGARQAEAGWYPGKALGQGENGRPQKPFRKPEEWSEATYKDRAADIEAVLNAVLERKTFESITINPRRIGVAGHSLGGYTALGLAGGWPTWKDGRVKAVLAMAAYCDPYVSKGDLGHMNVPVMYQGGTRDVGVSPTVRRFNGAYDLSSAPKYYVEFAGAGHFAWTNLNRRYQNIIETYSVAFFDRYLREKADPDRLASLTGNPPPSGVSYLKVSLK